MSRVREATDELLTDRPDLEDDLQALLKVDKSQERWSFDDVPLDSGIFGELVARNVVEKVDGEYQLADREAVRASLAGEPNQREMAESSTETRLSLRTRLQRVDTVLIGSILSLLAFVIVMRTAFSWSAVFRGEHIVLSGNDPYFYRFWLEELFRTNASPTSFPTALQDHDVTMIAVTYWLASLLGGGARAVSLVLAWYPVVAAVLVGVLVYVSAMLTFEDRRVALASLTFYAVTPILAYRMSLGYGDHHAFDYLLVALAVTGLLALVNERSDWRTITRQRLLGFIALAVAVASQVHAWRGGSLLILPIAGYIFVRVASDVRAGDSPVQANAWTLGALAVAAVIALLLHMAFSWSGVYRALSPTLLFAGSFVVVVTGELAQRRGLATRTLVGVELIGGVGTALITWVAVPAVQNAVHTGVAYFTRYGQTAITETYSLLSPEHGVITTPIVYLGFAFFLGITVFGWACWQVVREHQPPLLALTAYTGAFLVAALVQLRFAGQLAIVLAMFTGLGFVYLISAVDATTRPRPFISADNRKAKPHWFRQGHDGGHELSLPDKQASFSVVVVFLLVGGMGIVQTLGGTNDITIEGATYDTTRAIDDHAVATNTTWPDNYVFSYWGRSRAYNYYVNNQSWSYAYARQHYTNFTASENPSSWYDQLSKKPVGYVVVRESNGNVSAMSLQNRLWNHWGSRADGVAGVEHYRVVYANDDRKVFEPVAGAIIVGQSTPGDIQQVRTEFEANGATHTYERQVTATANGWYAIRVPYNGSYDTGKTTKYVSEAEVQNGTFVETPDSRGRWPLNASRGKIVFDITGGNHAWVEGANWTESGLSFNEDDRVRVPSGEELSPKKDFTLSVTFRTDNGTDYVNDVPFPRIAGTAPQSRFINSSGYVIALRRGHVLGALGNGSAGAIAYGPRVDDGEWHTVRLVREGKMVRLVLDGQTVQRTQYEGRVTGQKIFAIGATASGHRGFVGDIKNVTVSTST